VDQIGEMDVRRVEFARLIGEGVVPQTAGRRVGISRSVAQRWAILLRVGGLEKLSPLTGGTKRYPFVVKLLAVRARLEGGSEQAVLEAFGLRSSGTLARWVRAFEARRSGSGAPTRKRLPCSPSAHQMFGVVELECIRTRHGRCSRRPSPQEATTSRRPRRPDPVLHGVGVAPEIPLGWPISVGEREDVDDILTRVEAGRCTSGRRRRPDQGSGHDAIQDPRSLHPPELGAAVPKRRQ